VLEAHAIAARVLELQPAAQGLAATVLQDYAAQVRAALQGLQRPRVVVGASLGGLLAAICACEADALVLVNPLPPAPWHRLLAARSWDPVVSWQRNARLHSTREAMQDADDASALWAFRHWRDESGQALSQAHAGVEVAKPDCPALFVVSRQDEDVPPEIIFEWARVWRADRLETLANSHVGPLLGRQAQAIATQTVAWLNRLGNVG
jgi:pimeloyl-ACP methyl ester carboxylesterase